MKTIWTFAGSAEAVGTAFAHGDTHQTRKPAHDASKSSSATWAARATPSG